MTSDERKRGLRAAVDAKLTALFEKKADALKDLGVLDFLTRDWFFRGWQNDLLWEIIDSLVDECATYQNAVAVLLPAMQYRCLWEEGVGSMDGLLWIPFSGRVGSYEEAAGELENRRKDPKFRNVLIEARPAQPGPWPRPWDFRPADTPRFSLGDLVDYQDCRWEVISQHQYEHKLTIRSTGGTEVVTVPVDDVRPADKGKE